MKLIKEKASDYDKERLSQNNENILQLKHFNLINFLDYPKLDGPLLSACFVTQVSILFFFVNKQIKAFIYNFKTRKKGKSLWEMLEIGGQDLGMDEVASYLFQLALAVEYMHGELILHGFIHVK